MSSPLDFDTIAYDFADVYACGLGLNVPNDLTLETVAILLRASSIYALPAVDLARIVPDIPVRDLSSFYCETTIRTTPYNDMADEIVSAACENSPVVFITYGHPSVGTTVTNRLAVKCTKAGLKLRTTNAPCSIEAVCAIMGIEPFDGIQVWDATR